ncbi:hypothetical protein F4677DRAFT_413750 [Hypoxylon crocopeplum]|nr:hypothetical protein F4677DRAFT_413750 [Hypoxylon crocopeplum]
MERRYKKPRGGFRYTEKTPMGWRDNSTPKRQFEDLILEEMDQIWESDPRAKGRIDKDWHVNAIIRGGWLYDQARQEVKAQWIEQGIWKDSWEHGGDGPLWDDKWKHEERVGLVTDGDSNQQGARFRPKWKAEVIRQHDASRPINQFIYQVESEYKRLAGEGNLSAAAANINTRAWKKVRDRWISRQIWDEEWGTLPGMIWMHEKPLADSGVDTGPESVNGESIAKAVGERIMRERGARVAVKREKRPKQLGAKKRSNKAR